MRNNYTKLMFIAVLLFCPLLCSSVGATGLADTAWPKFQANLQNTGQSQYLGPQTSRVIWNFSAESSVGYIGGPTIGPNKTIYVGSKDGKLYALNPNGTQKWNYTTGAIYSSPAIGSDGTIYIGSKGDSKLYALNPNGTQKWNYTTGKYIYGSPAIGPDGTIYIGSYDSKLYALNPNGTQKWNYTTGSIYYGSPAIGPDGTIYVGSKDKNIYALNPSGTLKWSNCAGSGFYGAPAVDSDGIIYIGCYDSKLYTFYPNGTLKWSYKTGGAIRGSPAIASDGTIYIGSKDKNLYALNSDGTLKWKNATGDEIDYSSPAIGVDGTVYIGSEDNYIYAFSSDGTLKWCYPTGNDIDGVAAIGADNTLYIGSLDKKLYAFQDEAIIPVANFTASPALGDSPLTVSFTDLSENYPTSWNWDFGDGTANSTEQNPVHTYTSVGTYNVTLNVTNRAGSAEKSEIDYIIAKNAVTPIANFSAEPTTGNAPLAVQFTDKSSNNPTSWLWDFGDGSNSTDKNPVHTFEAIGNYTVNLTAVNCAGNTTESKEDYIIVTGIAPVANFSAEPVSGDVPLTVQFTDNSTGYPTLWLWDFGDGDDTNATEQDPVHTYIASGTYNVTLKSTNEYGNDTDSKIGYITVESLIPGEGAPVASFTTDSDSGPLPFTVQFTNTTTGNVSSLSWDFGDDETSDEQNPAHTYLDQGTYTVTLSATGPGGTTKATSTMTVAAPLTTDSGGSPLLTVSEGNVSGGLWHSSWPGFSKSATKTFTLPDYTKIKWARLYVDVYCRTMSGDNSFSMTINIDSDGDGIYEMKKQDAGSIVYDDTPAWLNDHVVRVTSDYLMWYDLTDNITGNKVNITATGGGDDGRIKHITLVVAYDDGDNDDIYYCVNQGHDIANYGIYTGSTEFYTSSVFDTGTVNLTSIYCASGDGVYTFNGKSLASGGSQGEYFGWRDWNATDYFNPGQNSTLTYTNYGGSEGYYKIQLALLSVSDVVFSGEDAPIANFSANVTSGEAPLTVQFTDLSINATSLSWAFGDDATSSESNPSHTYTEAGTYDVTLTTKNADGINVKKKTDYITVTSSDLSIGGTINTQPSSAVFAKEPNTVEVKKVTNTGSETVENVTLAIYADDVSETEPVNSTVIASLAAGEEVTVTIIDPTIREFEGGNVTYTAVLDPENTIAEDNESNNNGTSEVKSIKYNGYKGKGLYWDNGSNITTVETYDFNGGLLYSTQPSSSYCSMGWTNRTETWSTDNISVPANSTVESVLLYVSYNWDQTAGGYPWLNLSFNGNIIENGNLSTGNGSLYRDWSNFGSYADYEYGLCVYNVTDKFNSSGNSLVINPYEGNKALYSQVALYPSTLVVIYNNTSESRKQIFINEECDELAYSESKYGTTKEEATAYAPFTGMDINTSTVGKAILYSFAGSAGDEGNLIFNGNTLATDAWQGDGSGSIPYVCDVTDYLLSTGNIAGIQGTTDSGMLATEQILVVDYGSVVSVPVANFTADNVSNYSPLKVNFTDTSTGTPTSWYWEFGDGNDSTEQNPTHTYMQEGNYTVSLNVSNSLGSNNTTKIDYITAGTFIPAPVADFSASPITGEAPLPVQFTDNSTSSSLVTPSYSWDFGDNKTSSDRNPQHTYESQGKYNVSLTITNYGGSNTITKEDYITVESKQAAPVASFTMDSSSGNVPFTVKFTDKSTGSISSWKWNFGDGSTSTEQNPTHTFVTKGIYTITLAATGPGGTKTTTGTITATDPLTSNNYNGGIPLTTTASGTVSGGLWFDSYPGFATSASKTFSLPAYTDIKWARLYVDIYCGHMQNNYRGSATIKIDANGDNSYELTKSETFDTAYSFPGESGSGPIWLSDHMNRVTSDYLMWYDLADSISGKTVNVEIDTTKIDSSFDGRVKAMTLVVAYDDGDSDQIYYYVNQGHDTVNPLDASYTGSTTFSLPTLSNGVDSASLSAIYYASHNGVYTYQGKTLSSNTPSGTYYGDQTWDISSMISSGTNTLTYDNYADNEDSKYFKIPLALMSVKKHVTPGPVKPTAGFSANTTKGEAPLTVKFTDSSSGTPTSWAWDFDNNSTTDSKEQNPEYIYTTPGVYSVKLTVTNAAGTDDEIKTSYITVFEPGSEGKPDLSISGVVNPQASTVFAREPNTINVPVENSGYDPVTNIMVSLYASDVNDSVPVATTNIYTLAGQETTTVSLKDPTIRNLEGGTVTYTAKVDPENLIAEYNETNNNKSSYTKSVKYNGYKGKGLYWEGGSNITTKQTYDLRGDLIYSTQSDSAYKSVGWSTRTETWSSSDLPLPKGATLEKVLLYISYNWDTTPGGVPDVVATFNGKGIDPGTPYTDKSNFGGYGDYKYGLYPGIDVTELFNTAGNNTLTLTPNSKNSNAIYPSTLVVLYKDSSATRKQIFINEECDELAVSESSYGTTAEEATAYAPFTGLAIDPAKVQKATLYSFAGSAGPNEGNLYFNGNTVAKAAWQGTLSTASAAIFNVTEYLSAKTNEAQIQGTESGGMDALQQFLVIEYTETAPVAAFSADVMSGDAPLTVKFTDESAGSPASWAWDFDNDGRTDSEEQNPSYTYEEPGNYTVKLTVTNPWDTSTETKKDYITVKKPYLPKANFSAAPTTGISPLIVEFTDLSSRAEKWNWDFGDGNTSNEQSTSHTYTTAGNYIVNLTVSNSYGTNTCTTEILVKEFKSEDEEENYSVSFNEIEDINGTTVVINSSSGNVSVENNTIKIKSGKLNISINTEGVTEEEGKLTGNYTNATLETGSETSDLGGYLNNVSTSLNTSLLGSLSSLLKGNASITTKVVPGALDNETESAFQLAGASFAEGLDIAFSMEINTSGLEGVEIKNAYISMTVPGDYVDSHGGPEDFVVMSLHEGNVTVLDTSYTKSGDYYIFTAYSPDGFSVKALVSYTPIETESSHKSGGGGGDSSEKLSIIPAESSTSSGTESEETSTEESGTGKAEIMPTYSQESKQGSNLSTKPADEETKTSPGGVPGFEWGLAVLGVLLVFGMKRRGGEKRE